MATVLIIHHDKSVRSRLEMLARLRYDAEVARNASAGTRRMVKHKPDVIMVGHDARKAQALPLLRYMRDHVLKIPVVVVVPAGEGTGQPLLMKLGARSFVEYPVDQAQFDQAVSEALDAHRAATAPPPPISDEERNSNLSMLESKLNASMQCFAGKNQVYLQSMILGGSTTKPRICLRCSLRGEYGLNRNVYYEFIRDVCCHEPARCRAVQLFNATRESA